MKKRSPFYLSMRVNLTVMVVVLLGGVILVSWAFTGIMHHFGFTKTPPELAWLLCIGLILGTAVASYVAKWIFEPITKLGKAMQQVAEGDFSIRLETDRRFPEIDEIYANFNLMVSELGATEILQKDFVSNVSHEFKTPINAIEGYATLLQGVDHSAPEEQAKYIDKILLNTRRLSNLVGSILLLSKVDNQSIQTKQTTFRLDEQIRQSIVLLEPEWSKKNIEFDVDLSSITYTGNESLLIHVWNNLIGNAIKFDPQEGYIGLKLVREESTVRFTIEDNGTGIPEEALKHVFDRFYQSDSSHEAEGNGLGLALVKQIVSANAGTVCVENLPEKGCRFTVTLPIKN